MPSGKLRDQIIAEKLKNAPGDHEMICSKCGDINEIQDCPKTSGGYCCPICHATMKHFKFIPVKK